MKHTRHIQHSIEYIEAHLHEQLSLQHIAAQIGFAPNYFHHLFSRAVGKGVADYIRQRRLCQSALLLITTEQGILDIAMQCGFESQEAFTRAFKKEYVLPPGRYRKLFQQDATLTYHKGESTMNMTYTSPSESPIEGWFLSGTSMHHYAIELDGAQVHTGRQSAHLYTPSTDQAPSMAMQEQQFGTLMQQFQAHAYRGKRMRFSGFVKTSTVQQSCGLWMRVDDRYENVLQFDNMHNRPITGDCDWNHYAIVLDIPPESTVIAFGVMLVGKGHVWIDSLRFEEVGLDVPLTNLDPDAELPAAPQNLDFEQ